MPFTLFGKYWMLEIHKQVPRTGFTADKTWSLLQLSGHTPHSGEWEEMTRSGRVSEPQGRLREGLGSLTLGGGVWPSCCLSVFLSRKLRNVNRDQLSTFQKLFDGWRKGSVRQGWEQCTHVVYHVPDHYSPQGPPCNSVSFASWPKLSTAEFRAVRSLGDCMHWPLCFR